MTSASKAAAAKVLANLTEGQIGLVRRLSPAVGRHHAFLAFAVGKASTMRPELPHPERLANACKGADAYRGALTHCWADPTFQAPLTHLSDCGIDACVAPSQYSTGESLQPSHFARYTHRLSPMQYRKDMARLAALQGNEAAIRAELLLVDVRPEFPEAMLKQIDASVKMLQACPTAGMSQGSMKLAADYARFLVFVKRVREQGTSALVLPTLGIDLAWHAHMNHPAAYSDDAKDVIGYMPNHDFSDRVTQGVDLVAARDVLGAMWADQFGADVPNPYLERPEESTGGCASCGACIFNFGGGGGSSSGGTSASTGDAASCSSCASCGD